MERFFFMVAKIQSSDGKVIYEFKDKSELDALITSIRWARSGEGWLEDIMLSPILFDILKSLHSFSKDLSQEPPLAQQTDKVRSIAKEIKQRQLSELRKEIREFLHKNARYQNLPENEIRDLVDRAIYPFLS